VPALFDIGLIHSCLAFTAERSRRAGQFMLQRRALHDFPSSAAGRIVSNVVMMGMGEVRYATCASWLVLVP